MAAGPQPRPGTGGALGWHALTLDAQLAAGEPVDTDRLRAVRAGMLVAPRDAP